ncbi:MAG TPA: thiosulfate oxidation carrier protein SoxY [Burkholderiales bacterium]|nr:thiosulfate oxidation carrier protein SoxY [Burkholderiales bacterium]
MKRREFIAAAASLALAPGAVRAQENPIAPIDPKDPDVQSVTKGAPIRSGRVKLELPPLADNGNSVAMKLTVESPMTPQDHVRAVHLFSERNPVRHMAAFHLGPKSGRAEIASRIRLAGSQKIVALAEMSDGSFWAGSASVVVTLSACLDES